MDYILKCRFLDAEVRAAMHGKKLPDSLHGHARCAVIYGIRHHDNFALELRGLPEFPDFTRAFNARSIMSNIIPDMAEHNEMPYCIWHPDIASEDTYRSLAAKYPQMRYHVGRACAVAGYTELYHELDLLPEVSIAEEARDSGIKGEAIFDVIMNSPSRYAVMNDYTRTVNLETPRSPAFLNCDTAVRSSIDVPQKSSMITLSYLVSGTTARVYFDITECQGVCHYNVNGRVINWQSDDWFIEDTTPESKALASLLCSPLPADLPNVNKDLLILVAAYSGNIDRYVRLRRPERSEDEMQCIVRGIYHDTMFAKWWSQQPDALDDSRIQSAINARFIMNNDLSRITDETPDSHLPLLLHRPVFANRYTYEELALRKPILATHIARVCILANYQDSYDRLNIRPQVILMDSAEESSNPHYKADLLRRAAELDIDMEEEYDYRKSFYEFRRLKTEQTTQLLTNISASDIGYEDEDPDAACWADIGLIEVFVCAPEPSVHGVYTDEVFSQQLPVGEVLGNYRRPSRLCPTGRRR